MPFSHLLAHTFVDGLVARYLPSMKVRMLLLAALALVLLTLWIVYRDENLWRGFEVSAAPLLHDVMHLSHASESAIEAVENVAEVIEKE